MGFEIRPSKEGGRDVFRIYVDGTPTNAFGFTRESAQRILEKAVAMVEGQSAAPRPPPTPAYRPAPAPVSAPARRKGPPTGVMLADTWDEKQDPTGWWWSEKLNGVRAYWDGHTMWTRNGNVIDLPRWFADGLPNLPLDGELWCGRGKNALQKMVSIKARTSDPRWKDVRFCVFDAPEEPGGCEARWAVAERALKHSTVALYLPQLRVSSRGEVRKLLADVVAKGGEGGMLRRPGSRYVQKRTSDLLKVKETHSAEAKIIGYKPGKGKHAGVLGAYQCRFLDSKIEFDVGTGLTDRDRARPLPIGTIITVSWKMLTPDGKPHPASFEGERSYE